MWDNVLHALPSLRANKMRALLTMLGIIIGIGAVIAIKTVGYSLSSSITDKMSGFGISNITVSLTQKDSSDSDSSTSAGATDTDVRVRMFQNSTLAHYAILTAMLAPAATEKPIATDIPAATADPAALIGIQAQRQAGRALVGGVAALGRLTPASLAGAAELAERFSAGRLILTPWRGVLLPDVPADQADVALAALTALIAPRP